MFLVLGFIFVTSIGSAALLNSNTYYYYLQHDKVVKSTSSASEPINTYWYRGDFKVVNDTFTVNIDDITPYIIMYSTGTLWAKRIETSDFITVSSQTAFTRITLSQDLIVGTILAVDTDTLYVDPTNDRVGIGLTNPSYLLDAQNTAAAKDCHFNLTTYADSANRISRLNLNKSDTDTPGTLAQTDNGDYLGIISFQGVDSSSNIDVGVTITARQDGAAGAKIPTNLILETYSDTTLNSNQLVLHNDGNVGINDITPTYLLDVNGTGRFTGLLTADTSVYITLNCSALTFTDRTPYPKNTQEAYDSVLSMSRKNEGKVDHEHMNEFIKVENEINYYTVEVGTNTYMNIKENELPNYDIFKSTVTLSKTEIEYGRNLSASVSALNEVIKDLIKRIEMLEGK